MSKQKFYATTAIAYPNAKPHLGHFLEFIQADTLTRFKKMKGIDAFLLTGTDEHGQKMVEKARASGLEVEQLVEQNRKYFTDLKETIDMDYSDFIATTQERHIKTAQDVWTKIYNKGDLYKKEYEGLYCVGCESFKTEKDLMNGKCPEHDKAPILLREENYFFRLSKYQDALIEKLESRELQIIPEFRTSEIVNVARSGLMDVSFSRPKESLEWGIEVPNNSKHVMYVWCDALTNYLSGAGYSDDPARFEKYWPCDVHMIGKDISRFHALIWPAMLLSAEIPLPKAIFIHEFVTSKGKKMSKTIGNVIDPYEVVNRYGSEALRFFLLKEGVKGADIDFTWARFHNIYEAELLNGLGNLVNRVLVIAQKYTGGRVPKISRNEDIESMIRLAWREYDQFLDQMDFKAALESCLNLVYFSNRFINEQEPWKLFKEDKERFFHVLFVLLELLANIALMLEPFIPRTARRVQKVLGVNSDKISIMYGKVREGFRIEPLTILFPKIDPPRG